MDIRGNLRRIGADLWIKLGYWRGKKGLCGCGGVGRLVRVQASTISNQTANK
jgi:hypothetical protein